LGVPLSRFLVKRDKVMLSVPAFFRLAKKPIQKRAPLPSLTQNKKVFSQKEYFFVAIKAIPLPTD
jgi:hypothetical protein